MTKVNSSVNNSKNSAKNSTASLDFQAPKNSEKKITQQKKFSKSVYDTLLQAYRPFLFKILTVTLLGFVGRLIFLSNAQFIAKYYDSHSVMTSESLLRLAWELFALLAVAFAFTVAYRTLFSRLSAMAVSRIYDETTYRVSRFPLSFFDAHPVGKITTRFSSDYGNVFRLFGGPLAEFLSIIFDLISIVLLMTLTHPLFLLNLLIAGFSFQWILKRNQFKLRTHRREVSILRGPSVSHFSETVQGNLTIRQNQKTNSFIHRFLQLDQLYIASKINIIKSVLQFSTELNVISTLVFFCNGLMGLYLVKAGSLGAAQVAVVLGFTILATQTLQMFFEWYSQFEEALVGVERLDEYLRSPIEEGAYLPAQADFKTHHPHISNLTTDKFVQTSVSEQAHLSVQELYFKYPSQDEMTLKNISFQLKKGEKLGIIGRTGAGKSTLIAALLRLYPFQQGQIKVNNQYLKNVEEHRSLFSLISQDQFFIKGTLRENIDLFHQHSNEKLKNILQAVGLQKQLTDAVEEKGQNLSQGEKQLLSLARGLLQNAEIFIFDEATANIDPLAEQLITKALQETLADKTQIRIAHRLQTVLDCDKVLWIDHGNVKKLGPVHEVLVEFEGLS